jgi:hypothetical protein
MGEFEQANRVLEELKSAHAEQRQQLEQAQLT